MLKRPITFAAIVAAALFARSGNAQVETDAPMTFFVTSTTHSGDLGGLEGADAECQRLAEAAGAGNRTWRAYLSTHGNNTEPAVNARDRIGNGPWHNARGVKIADDVAYLHGDIQRDTNLIYRETALTEKGELV
ncbi:MAG TPA: lectin, partial [Gammaproteobacteria bacterium]